MPTFPFADHCPCRGPITRRDFLKTATAAGVGAASSLSVLDTAQAAPSPKSKSETLVTSLYKTLSEEQRKTIVFPFDHPLRSKVDNNWNITKQTVGDFFTADQQAMIREVFRNLHSPEYADKVIHQVEHDAGKEGFGGC